MAKISLTIALFTAAMALAGAACGGTHPMSEISVKEALRSTPDQYPDVVTIVAEPVRQYGLALRDEQCISPCDDVIALEVPEAIRQRNDVAFLLSAIDYNWKMKKGKLRAVLVVRLVHGLRPLNIERSKFGWGLGRVELIRVLEVRTENGDTHFPAT